MKTLPFDLNKIQEIIGGHPTPFHIFYDEHGIQTTAKNLNQDFDWAPGFINYYTVKALPNPEVLSIVKRQGMSADCSSSPELFLAERAGFHGGQIMFTSNDTSTEEFVKTAELGAIINLDDYFATLQL